MTREKLLTKSAAALQIFALLCTESQVAGSHDFEPALNESAAIHETSTRMNGIRPPPTGRKIKVAVVLTEGAVVIDYAGPWEVFSNVHTGSGSMSQQMPFELYTVGRDKSPIHTAGTMDAGMTIVPDYGYVDAPDPDIVVVGAQLGDEQLGSWLRKMYQRQALIMSVCTGAFKLAEAGLLDDKSATTHHDALQRLANQYPHIAVQSSVRYVQSDPFLLTAGGLSSGIDAALHVVALYYGRKVAQAAADDMEYLGRGWKTNVGIGTPSQIEPTIPLAYRDRESIWQGPYLPAYPSPTPSLTLVLHLVQIEGQFRATIDVPSATIFGQPVKHIEVQRGQVHFGLDAQEGPLEFAGAISSSSISGSLIRGGSVTPMVWRKTSP